MRVKYVGPYDAVEVPELGVAVRRGEPFDLRDGDAKLLLQQDTWEEVAPAKAPSKTKGSDA